MVDSKRGFTLVELLAAIVIIAILGVTAVAAYNGISKNAKEKAYEAKVKQIETAAAKWAEENNVNYKTQVSVNKLIVQGYLQADAVSDLGEALIENPVDGQNMICKVVDLSRKEGQYNADFVSSKENCNLANQAIYDEKIIVSAYGADGNKIDFNDNYLSWTNQNISLVVSSPDFDGSLVSISYDFDGDTITKNDSGLSKSDNKYQANADAYYNVYNVSADLILNNYVVITYTLNDGSIYSRTVVIRIDKETPTFVASTTNDWIAVDKPITIYADDGEGSGVKGFYISKDKDDLGTFYETDYKKTVNLTESGTYYVKVIDNVSNLSNADDKSGSIKVNNVDKTVPTCEVNYIGTLGDNDWYVTKVVPNIKSNEAGLSGLYYGYDTKDVVNYDSGYMYEGDSIDIKLSEVGETASKTYYCFVKSLAGNTGKNSKSVKVDITKPVITDFEISSQSSSYNTSQVNVSLKANDLTSGLSKMCISETNNVNSCSWKNFSESSTYDIVDGYSTGAAVYFYAWVKDKAGNVSVVARPDKVLDARNDIPASPDPDSIYPDSIPYIPYKECSETVNDGSYTCGTYSGCTNVCGGGTEYATKTQNKKDKNLGVSCPSVVTEKGCTKSCGGVRYEDGTTCSDKCSGSGTLNRVAYSTYDNTRCTSYDETSGGSACGGVKYKDGSTCSDKCSGSGSLNRIAYSTFDNTRCTSYDKTSGGAACGGVKYENGTTCSNKCGGTYNRLAYSTYDNTRCTSYDKSTGGPACGGTKVSCGSCSANSGATCSTTCGTGTKAGTKTCTNISTIDNSYCSDAASQSCTVSCTESSGCCPTHTGTAYGTCSDVCGGTQDVYEVTYDCNNKELSRKKTSSQSCGGKATATCTAWTNSGTCSNACGGTISQTRTCTVKSQDGTKTCSTSTESQNVSCGGTNTSYTYGSWSSWSTCSDACGGTQTRTRTGYKYSTDGTKTCSDAKIETGTQNCGGTSDTLNCDGVTWGDCNSKGKKSRTCKVMSSDGTKSCGTEKVTANCTKKYECREATYIHSSKSLTSFHSPQKVIKPYGWVYVSRSSDGYYRVYAPSGQLASGTAGTGWVKKGCLVGDGKTYCANADCSG